MLLILLEAMVCGILRAIEYAARGPIQGSNYVPIQSALTVEHVLPQSWRTEPSYEVVGMADADSSLRDVAIHRFGNLTLLTQPINRSVSNGPFNDKRSASGDIVQGKHSKLGQSALLMNTYFNQQGLHKWDDDAIATRANALYSAATLVWARPASITVTPKAVAKALSSSESAQVVA